jgi:hypothetical protein
MTNHPERSDIERAADLRAASDTLMQRLDRLHDLETRKRELPPDRPEFIRLAREIEDLARAVLYSSGEQVELAEQVHADVKAGDLDANLPIRETPPKRDAVAVLAEWRAAERRLAAAPPGSGDEADARAEVERLRAEYRRVTAPIPNDPGPPPR